MSAIEKRFGILITQQARLRPTAEDYLRALYYGGFATWTVVFTIFPPVAYIGALDTITRLAWVGSCFVGAVVAFFGALLRIDLKMELPGIALMFIGPLFYTASQVWFSINPPPDAVPSARYALIVYAILPLLASLPRLYSLYMESRRSSDLRKGVSKLIDSRLEGTK